ncbi:hypothetical protein CFBP6626_07560 [Agrobacterium tumefaciens]|nr:hypothetical protein CFBP6626_07560 [Agrobacterium tumefaciens]CUX07666.1 hypothetical protein AGR5A_Cc10023 [Agrobacterium genomosp. 5 str. CFBP 6626]
MGTPAAKRAATYEEAERRARCGNRDWIAYADKSGTYTFEPCNRNAIKTALLTGGTQNEFILIMAGSGCGMIMNWRLGLNLLKQRSNRFCAA